VRAFPTNAEKTSWKLTSGVYTDHGSQCCSRNYQKLLREHCFRVSTSGARDCYSNNAMETCFKTIKVELLGQRFWRMRRGAEIAIFECVNGSEIHDVGQGWKRPLAPWRSKESREQPKSHQIARRSCCLSPTLFLKRK